MAVKRDNITNKWYYYGSYKVGSQTKQYKKRGFDRKQDAIQREFDESRLYNDTEYNDRHISGILRKKNQGIHIQQSQS